MGCKTCCGEQASGTHRHGSVVSVTRQEVANWAALSRRLANPARVGLALGAPQLVSDGATVIGGAPEAAHHSLTQSPRVVAPLGLSVLLEAASRIVPVRASRDGLVPSGVADACDEAQRDRHYAIKGFHHCETGIGEPIGTDLGRARARRSALDNFLKSLQNFIMDIGAAREAMHSCSKHCQVSRRVRDCVPVAFWARGDFWSVWDAIMLTEAEKVPPDDYRGDPKCESRAYGTCRDADDNYYVRRTFCFDVPTMHFVVKCRCPRS